MKRMVFIIAFIFYFGNVFCQDSFIIIINSSVTIDSLRKEDLRNIFLGKKTKWDNGQLIKPAMLTSGELHENFIDQIVRKSTFAFDNYWRQRIYTGQGVPPVQLEQEQELIDYVKNTQGAIGYMSFCIPEEVSEDLKTLKIVE